MICRIVLILGLIFWAFFSYTAMKQTLNYILTTEKVPASIEWQIKKINDEAYRPFGFFTYTVDGKIYQKEELFEGGLYRTPYAAEKAVEELRHTHQTAYYSKNNPNVATLEKFFPLKKIIYSLIVLLLVFYSVWRLRHLN